MDYFKGVCAEFTNISPTRYKISTITATGDVNSHLHLDVFFAATPLTSHLFKKEATWGFSSVQFSVEAPAPPVEVPAPSEVPTEGPPVVVEAPARKVKERKERKEMLLVRRSALDDDGNPLPAQKSSRRKRRQARHFDNQVTLIYWENERLDLGVVRGVNVKVFRNGRVQMTGVRNVVEGSRIIDRIVETVKGIQVARGDLLVPPSDKSDASSASSTSNTSYKVCLINSDFNIGFPLKRDKLHAILTKACGLVCSFEPCIYPGVKLSFMWNHGKTSQNEKQTGVCTCPTKCTGTGDGYGPSNCRKVTCAIFQSGCTIITGAHSYTQLEDTYRFVCEIMSKHREVLQRHLVPSE